MLRIYRELSGLLNRRERILALMVFVLMVGMALMEVVGVASIMPFMAVLSNPDVVERNEYLAAIYDFLGFESTNSFLFFLGGVVFVLLISSLALKALTMWAQFSFSHMRNHALGCRMVANYLGQPYHWFLNRHSSDIATTLLAEVNKVINGALFPAMQLVAQTLVVVCLLAFLVAIDPLLALAAAVVLGSCYGVLYVLVRRYLGSIGRERLLANRARFQVVQEAFGGIKDVKIAGLEATFLGRFRGPSRRLARNEVMSKVIGELPSFAMQAVLFGGMMLVILYVMASHNSINDALPTLAAYALAGYRLMPALQSGYRQLTQLRFAGPALQALHRDLNSLTPVSRKDLKDARKESRLKLSQRITLRDVHYTYPGAERAALRGVSMEIDACTTVGLVGSTGSGKTTAVDLMLGLLRPTAGRLEVDGEPITADNLRRWQRNLGYVPQHIYLADDTISANIAFGIPPREIDPEAVERAARIADLHNFVITELKDGYDTRVGERGVRLSGGQRQRIGIARALYHDPEVLILDEATSALDNVTERAVMEAVNNLGSRKTIVVIAHRLTTVQGCDRIFMLDHGSLVGDGTYDDLVADNEQFRAMAGQRS